MRALLPLVRESERVLAPTKKGLEKNQNGVARKQKKGTGKMIARNGATSKGLLDNLTVKFLPHSS